MKKIVPYHPLRQTKAVRPNDAGKINVVRFFWNWDERTPLQYLTELFLFLKKVIKTMVSITSARFVKYPGSVDLHTVSYRHFCSFHIWMAHD